MRSSQARKYSTLIQILDQYVSEGAKIGRRKSYFDTTDQEKENQARSRAFIHLYIASTYGILDFEERERTITDASYDGGIDGYYIDSDMKIIDVIQSKFRIGHNNFESKYISPEEVLAIDIDRILAGNREDKNGSRYNGYILAFIEKISKINDIARYTVKVTILANVKYEQYALVERLFSGDQINIINFDRCYGELVLPAIRGEQHYTSSMRLHIDLSNKSGSSRLSAEIVTAHGPSQLTVVLVPTSEIAKLITRYRNSILRYNPRSYLEFSEQRTNEGIRDSIVEVGTGEFAILNNGITIVSDETYVSERVGAKNKAQVEIVNPQIINGGQTAFTLGRIYEEASENDKEALFNGKEVVLRIITLPQIDENLKRDLILNISSATNSQTAVSAIDRTASNDENRMIAEIVFKKTGLLYEPKRGEYAEALRKNYIGKDDIVERSLFTRLMHIACGRYSLGVERKMMRSTGGIIPGTVQDVNVDIFLDLYEIYKEISGGKISQASEKIATDLAFSVFIRSFRLRVEREGGPTDLFIIIDQAKDLYPDFINWAQKEMIENESSDNQDESRIKRPNFKINRWKRSKQYPEDVESYIALLSKQPSLLDRNIAAAP